MAEQGLKRVLVVGSPASGKSQLAQRLSQYYDLPIQHLDTLYFGPNWSGRDPDQWHATIAQLTAGDRWIMDGNHLDSIELRIARAEAIFWVNFGRVETLTSVMRRMIFPTKSLIGVPEGCRESWDSGYLGTVWRNHQAERRHLEKAIAGAPRPQMVLRLTRPNEMNYFLRRYSGRPKK